jgi:hypothetical protein
MAVAAKGSRSIAFLLAACAAASLGSYFDGNGDRRGWLLFAAGFSLSAVAELYRPPGLFRTSLPHIPATRELVWYCMLSACAVALAVVGSVLQWP